MKNSITLVLLFLFTLNACAQKKGHEIIINVADMPNETILLAYHYSGKQYISDTLTSNAQGIAVLKNELTAKPKGVYLAVFPSLENKHFEFLIGNDQHFTITTLKSDLNKNLKFKNSPENEFFYKDIENLTITKKKADALNKQMDEADEERKKTLKTEYEKLNKDFLDTRLKIINDHPNMFYSKLLNMMRDIEVPESPKNEKGEPIDPNFAFHYYRNNYWNYTDFSDDGILRTPIFHNKLMDYFEKYTYRDIDSLIKSCDIVLKLAEKNSEVYKYTLVNVLNKYANSKIMGHDGIYVHLVQEYYAKGKAPWTDAEQLLKIEERANAIAPLLLGKISPDLTLRDTSKVVKYRLHDLPFEHTIVFVWDPDCGHCKKVAPILNDFLNAHRQDGIGVYGISTVTIDNLDKWKDFVKEKNLNWINVADLYLETNFRKLYDISSTPQLYVLDKNKKIVAKRLGAEQLEGFFHDYLKSVDNPKYTNFKKDIPENAPN